MVRSEVELGDGNVPETGLVTALDARAALELEEEALWAARRVAWLLFRVPFGATVVYTGDKGQSRPDVEQFCHGHTFGEETGGGILEMATQVPAVAEIIVAFDELDAIAFCEAQLVGAASYKLVYARTL